MSFEAVFDRLHELIPELGTRPGKALQAAQLVQDWLAAGCDTEQDILPAINATFARMTGRPSSAAYFDKAVRQAKEKRVGSVDEDRKKAERIAWVRKHFPMRYECDAALHGWMKGYEAKHGPVA